MKNLAKELLVKQENERVALGTKAYEEIKDLVEVIVSLGCEFLLKDLNGVKVEASNKDLETTIAESSKRIEELKAQVTRAKNDKEAIKTKLDEAIKEIATLKESANTSSKTEDNDILVKAIEAKDKYIIELEEKLQDKAYAAANDGYVVDGLEISVKVVKDLNDQISALQEELAHKESAEYKLKEMNKALIEELKAFKFTTQEKDKAIEKPVAEKENKKEVKKENKTKESKATNTTEKINVRSLVECQNYKRKREDVHMYDGGSFYVLASKICQQITVIPAKSDLEVTNEIVEAYQKELVKLGYSPERTNVSPVVINHKEDVYKGYFARTDAFLGVDKFHKEDVFSGYVYDMNNCFLFTWDPASHAKPAVYKLRETVEGKPHYVSPYEKNRVSAFVEKMFELYTKEISSMVEEQNKQIAKNTEKARQIAENNAKRSSEFKAKVEDAKSSGKVLGSSKNGGVTKKKRTIKKKAASQVSNQADSQVSDTLLKAAQDF